MWDVGGIVRWGRVGVGRFLRGFFGGMAGVGIKNDSYNGPIVRMYCGTWNGVYTPCVPMPKRPYEDIVAEDSEYE
jgi:hypothetical protein